MLEYIEKATNIELQTARAEEVSAAATVAIAIAVKVEMPGNSNKGVLYMVASIYFHIMLYVYMYYLHALWNSLSCYFDGWRKKDREKSEIDVVAKSIDVSCSCAQMENLYTLLGASIGCVCIAYKHHIQAIHALIHVYIHECFLIYTIHLPMSPSPSLIHSNNTMYEASDKGISVYMEYGIHKAFIEHTQKNTRTTTTTERHAANTY